jgi:tight adherence protein B
VTVLTSAMLAGLGAAVLCRPGPRRALRGRLRPGGAADRAWWGWRGWWATPLRDPGPVLLRVACWVVPAVVLVAALLAVLGPSGLLLACTAALVTVGVGWLHAVGRRRGDVERGRRRTVEVCDALAAEMRAGQPAVRALQRTAEEHPLLQAAARACALGGDVPAALRGTGDAPGAGGMATVAAAWQVAEGSGSGLAAALQRVADSLRAEEAARAEVAAGLAPARATARLLAVLPVFGLLLGMGIGGDPLALLLSTLGGNVLLLAGSGLALAGTVWVERLAQRVES